MRHGRAFPIRTHLGKPPGIGSLRTLQADPGALTLAGNTTATMTKAVVLAGSPGALTLTGINAALFRSKILAGDVGALTLAGADATMNVARTLAAAAGALTLAGGTTALNVARTMTGAVAALTLAGSDATMVRGKILAADPGALTLSGGTAALNVARLLAADPGAITVSGGAAGLALARVLTADAAALTLTGAVAALDSSAAPPVTPPTAGVVPAGSPARGKRKKYLLDGERVTLTRDELEARLETMLEASPAPAEARPAPKVAAKDKAIVAAFPAYPDLRDMLLAAQEIEAAQALRAVAARLAAEEDERDVEMLLLWG